MRLLSQRRFRRAVAFVEYTNSTLHWRSRCIVVSQLRGRANLRGRCIHRALLGGTKFQAASNPPTCDTVAFRRMFARRALVTQVGSSLVSNAGLRRPTKASPASSVGLHYLLAGTAVGELHRCSQRQFAAAGGRCNFSEFRWLRNAGGVGAAAFSRRAVVCTRATRLLCWRGLRDLQVIESVQIGSNCQISFW